MSVQARHEIDGEIRFSDAPGARDDLAAWCAADLKERTLEISEGPCGQVALQLLLCAVDRLTAAETPFALGERAAAHAARRLSAQN